ncbi:hypothetical protein AS359_13545 [Comamonas kerstersii]|uniref:Uncharacterized protein n=1 Tax=Comamonas kerstersii TaxID=225992 RepID=A0A0W7YY06_9BURK|nr:hypothetical protein AS359_13545 [Comamonas kerstersii]
MVIAPYPFQLQNQQELASANLRKNKSIQPNIKAKAQAKTLFSGKWLTQQKLIGRLKKDGIWTFLKQVNVCSKTSPPTMAAIFWQFIHKFLPKDHARKLMPRAASRLLLMKSVNI